MLTDPAVAAVAGDGPRQRTKFVVTVSIYLVALLVIHLPSQRSAPARLCAATRRPSPRSCG